MAGLGLLPLGLAFYCWDYGVKHGNIQLLGATSYAAPILSTLLLVASGLGVACLLITAGACCKKHSVSQVDYSPLDTGQSCPCLSPADRTLLQGVKHLTAIYSS